MKETSLKDRFSNRKIDLQHQILEASDLRQNQNLTVLVAQWVHRYGLETLPKFDQGHDLFNLEETSLLCEIPSLIDIFTSPWPLCVLKEPAEKAILLTPIKK